MNKMFTGFFMAWGNFTQVPCPVKIWDEKARKWMVALMPFAGFACGILQFAAALLLDLFAHQGGSVTAQPMAAALLTCAPFLICGFIHLDGYMDVSDAVLSRRPLEKRREILKDSRVGAFAVIMVVLFFLMYFAAMISIVCSEDFISRAAALVIVPVTARALASRDVLVRKPMSQSQYAAMERENGIESLMGLIFCLASAVSIAILFNIFGQLKYGLAAFAGALVGQIASSGFGRKNLQGMNGDIAGFSIVVGELTGVIACSLI